jgi:hypothetical protein
MTFIKIFIKDNNKDLLKLTQIISWYLKFNFIVSWSAMVPPGKPVPWFGIFGLLIEYTHYYCV